MVVIKIYLVAYKNTDLVIRILRSIFDGSNDLTDVSVTLMNNYVPQHHSTLELPEEFSRKITIIHNSARPSFSTGHLARSWNECIVNAMVDMKNPQCDILVLAQADTIFAPGAIKTIKEHVKSFNYLTFGAGDECQIMTPESIRKIGLYDEHFCGIGYQEADYYRRAFVLNSTNSSINDQAHSRVHNPVKNNVLIDTKSGYDRRDPENSRSLAFHHVSSAVYRHKWGDTFYEYSAQWPTSMIEPKQFIMYPYFECDLPDADKNTFVINESALKSHEKIKR